MRLDAIRASLGLGIAWGIWHLPFLWLPTSPKAMVLLMLFLIECIAETFLYT